MAKPLLEITDELREFIEAQRMFFVATAPLDASGHVNLSPKGYDCFRVLSPTRVAYLDLTGSGNETSAHLLENGRITFMFCSFEGPPRILRLYGRGRTLLPGSDEWRDVSASLPSRAGARQIVVVDVARVQTSCGFGVPRYDFVEERDNLDKWTDAKTPVGIEAYWRDKNALSIDGLPTPLGERIASADS